MGIMDRAVLRTVDSHTAGEPTRVIVSGLPALDADTVTGARNELAGSHDWVRRVAVWEPRGHRDVFAAALIPTRRPGCSWALVYMSADGYPHMCGHATSGAAMTAVRLGRVQEQAPTTRFSFDTPIGTIAVEVVVNEQTGATVTFRNQPAWRWATMCLAVGGATVDVTVAYGGQWYGFVDAEALGLQVEPSDIPRLVAAAATIRDALAAESFRCPDPRGGCPQPVRNIVWCASPRDRSVDVRQMTVSAGGSFDRSPCGSATCAHLAIRFERGSLEPRRPFVVEGILGTRFNGSVVDTRTVKGRTTAVATGTGQASLTGQSELWCEAADPLREGFLLPALSLPALETAHAPTSARRELPRSSG
jgi:proline racemase